MINTLPRTALHSSPFIRFLADLAIDGTNEAADWKHQKPSFAERLAEWLDLTDAIALASALATNGRKTPATQSRASSELEAQLAQVRSALAESISADGISKPGKARIKLPAPTAAADFASYRRFYAAHQRDMEASISTLRAGVRVVLAKRSPALRQLAELDAVLDKAIGERERNLLASVPQLIEKHFLQLRQAHHETLAESQQTDDPARWIQPGGWLARFCQDMQGLLLAELAVRLQPVQGLIEAFSNEVTGRNE